MNPRGVRMNPGGAGMSHAGAETGTVAGAAFVPGTVPGGSPVAVPRSSSGAAAEIISGSMSGTIPELELSLVVLQGLIDLFLEHPNP